MDKLTSFILEPGLSQVLSDYADYVSTVAVGTNEWNLDSRKSDLVLTHGVTPGFQYTAAPSVARATWWCR